MKSILTDNENCCIVCGETRDVKKYYISGGKNKNAECEKYGIYVPLCAEHLFGKHGVYKRGGSFLKKKLEIFARQRFSEHFPEENFNKIFGGSK